MRYGRIEVKKCSQCGVWYAMYKSRTFGVATQWGQTKKEAEQKLVNFIREHWQEEIK